MQADAVRLDVTDGVEEAPGTEEPADTDRARGCRLPSVTRLVTRTRVQRCFQRLPVGPALGLLSQVKALIDAERLPCK